MIKAVIVEEGKDGDNYFFFKYDINDFMSDLPGAGG